MLAMGLLVQSCFRLGWIETRTGQELSRCDSSLEPGARHCHSRALHSVNSQRCVLACTLRLTGASLNVAEFSAWPLHPKRPLSRSAPSASEASNCSASGSRL
ncbi:hypothetical protein ACFPRL_18855 [Pseudoclavibacter helvolus]